MVGSCLPKRGRLLRCPWYRAPVKQNSRPGRMIALPQMGVELLIDPLWKLLVMSPREIIWPKRALTSICMEVPLNVAFCDAFLSP